MRPDGGGGGATILIDPDSLRRAGSRLKGIAGELQRLQAALSSLDVPLLPPQVAGTVPGAITAGSSATSTYAPSLNQIVVELTRRAFWAEYADQMMAGYPLSGAALKQFEQYMMDGSLLKYATPNEAAAAGVELAKIGANFRKDPSILFVLAADLKGGESATDKAVRDAFSGAFVEQFGATRMNEIPRAIQALESSRQLAFNANDTDPFVLRDLALLAQQQGIDLHGADPVKDLLAPFSIALANATTAGLVTRTTEEEIASNKDAWATAALLSQGGHFGTNFLLDCFKSGVVDKIVQDSPYHIIGNPGGLQLPVEYTLGWSDGHPLPNDTKQIVLAALARNGEASSLALTQPIDVKVADEYGQWSNVTDPVQLLYQYGHFDDHGAAFGDVFYQGESYAHLHGEGQQASHMTLDLIDQVVNHGRDDMQPVQVALAHTVGDHYVRDLHLGAEQGADVSSYDPDHDGIPGGATPNGLDLSRPQVQALLSKLIDDSDSRAHLLNGVVAYQTNLIHQGIAGTAPGWAHQLGSFDGVLNSANSHNAVADVQAAQAREAAISKALDSVVSLVPLPHPFDIAASQVPDLIASHYGPHGPSATDQSAQFHDQLLDQLNASIVAGYVDAHPDVAASIPTDVHGMQGLPYTPTNFLDADQHVIPWSKMSDYQQRTFQHWYSTHDHGFGGDLAAASRGMTEHSADQTGN